MRPALRASLVAAATVATAGANAPTVLARATPAAVTASSPLRIVASTKAIKDATAKTWQPDAPYALGGRLTTSTHSVRRTASHSLYQHARLGVTGYDVPVSASGTYFVDLLTSETRGALPGKREWDVTAEDQSAATDVDPARDAGPSTAWHVLFAVPVTDGVLNIRIVARVGTPVVDAVQVNYENAETAGSTLFSDTFDGAAGALPDATKWRFAKGGNGWGNNELETYTRRPVNAALDGAGNLDIVARHETYTGSDGITRNYTSARLTTVNTFAFQYGAAVARIRVPGGQGLWPAFWSLGANRSSAGWPLCGEMDVMENRGDQLSTVHATVHAAHKGATSEPWTSSTATNSASTLSSDYHTYGLVWGPDAMAMTLDGRTYFSLSASDLSPTLLWNFNHPFFLLLNLAVGGNTAGPPDDTTPFPAEMAVDYVQVTG
jgi:beta-glucanase (GH16 family)